MLKTYSYFCEKCNVTNPITVEYDDREKAQECPHCGNPSPRTWQDASPPVQKASFIDGTKRFDKIRDTEILKRERQKAKARGDTATYKKSKKELLKVNRED